MAMLCANRMLQCGYEEIIWESPDSLLMTPPLPKQAPQKQVPKSLARV